MELSVGIRVVCKVIFEKDVCRKAVGESVLFSCWLAACSGYFELAEVGGRRGLYTWWVGVELL